MFSVAARQAREADGNATPRARRGRRDHRRSRPCVPGAQRPDAMIVNRAPEPVAAPSGPSTPEDVYSFLSNFQSGVAVAEPTPPR